MKYELVLNFDYRDEASPRTFDAGETGYHKIHADNLVHLCAQLQTILVQLAEKEKEREVQKVREKYFDDNIPF